MTVFEALSIMFQFGMFILGLLSLIIVIIKFHIKK